MTRPGPLEERRPPGPRPPTGDRVLALDFGGTKLAVGLVDVQHDDWLAVRRRPTPEDATASIEAICALADDVLAQDAAAGGPGRVRAIGVSFGGHVDTPTGVVLRSVQVPGWENTALAALLSERYDAPSAVANDGAAGVMGEWVFGSARGLDNVVYLTVSTGVGGGLILDGRPYEGTAGFAAEFGHVEVEVDGELCGCGLTGCLETVASGPAIARRAERAVDGGRPSSLSGLEHAITGIDVSVAAEAGDALAVAVLEGAGRAVGRAASMLITALDPQAVLLGGGVAHAPAPFWDAFRGAIRTPARADRWLRLGPATFVDDAPLYGARALARRLAGTDPTS